MRQLTALAILLSLSVSLAQPSGNSDQDSSRQRGHHHQKLTDEQRSCLEEILGKPEDGDPPTREARDDAFQQCNISLNAKRTHGRPPGPRDELSPEQRACLESKIGEKGEGQPPTKEEFETAHSECGITRPDLPDQGD